MNKKQKILTILALAVFLVLMWRDKWFYDFWFRGGEHRMTLIKVSHAGPQLCRTRWNRRTLLIARRSISLLSWFATSVFFFPQRQKRVGPLGSLSRARTRGMSLNRCGHDVIDDSCTRLRESATVGAWISKRLAAIATNE